MKKFIIAGLCAVTFAQLSANAATLSEFFNTLHKNYGASYTLKRDTESLRDDTYKKISDITAQGAKVEEAIPSTFLSIVKQLTPQNSNAKLIEIDLKQKNADIYKIMSDYTTLLEQNRSDVVYKIRNMSNTDKANLKNDIDRMLTYGKSYLNLKDEGIFSANQVLKSVIEPETENRLLNRSEEVFSGMTDKAKTIFMFIKELNSLLQQAGL
jgi:hypothetical protein